jgi:hypothetical protein
MAKCQTCGNEVDVVTALENLYPVHGAYEKNIQMLAIEEIIKLRKRVAELTPPPPMKLFRRKRMALSVREKPKS